MPLCGVAYDAGKFLNAIHVDDILYFSCNKSANRNLPGGEQNNGVLDIHVAYGFTRPIDNG